MGELSRSATNRSYLGSPLLVATLLLLGISGCSSDDVTPQPTAISASPVKPTSSGPTSSGRAEYVEGESVTEAPKPISGKAILEVASRTGGALLPLGDIDAGRLGIQVNCQGKGTLTVTVTPVGLSFPLECVAYEVSSTYNQMHMRHARGDSTLQISAPTTVRWAVTVEK
ncbi:hypothetical protein ABZ705_05360 [Streptomyces sp. NPDC006984]|uniref:hypothetical protein n=1 Tax=Streptomyces sp. NPDC006984 TaxID=3155463 RepID=UPI0033E2F698